MRCLLHRRATSSIEYCKDATATALTATASGGHTLVWYGTDGTTVLSGAPTPSTGSVGSTNYYVAQQNTTTGCEGAKTTITVTVNALPVAPTATTTVDYCQDATATALTATASSGHTLVWYGTDGTTVLSGAPVPPTATAGSTNYYVAQENTLTGCEGPKTTITVTVSGTPSAPTVSDVSYCKDDVATALTATASSGNTLVWYDANQSELTSGAPTPLTSSVGTTTYYVAQQTASGCEGSKSTITVTVNALPVAPSATSSIEYCKDATATALTATASGGHTLVWYGTDGTTVLSGAPTPSTGSVGSTNYYVAQQNTTTGCEGAKTTITVTVNALPVAPTATTTVDYCQDATATALTATASSGHTLVWYGTDGTTVLSGAPVPPTATAGSTNYYVAQENTLTGCEGPKTTITVTVSGTPSAPTVSDVSYCKDDVATALTATASSGNTLVWYDANQSELTSGAPTPLTSSVGTTTYYVAQQTASGCEGSKSTITVTVNALPVAPSATSSIEYCKDATATALTATASGGHTLVWYGTDGTTVLSGAPTPSTGSVGSTNYYVAQQNTTTGCEGAKTTITVTVNALPVAPTATTTVDYCQDATATALTATASSGHTLVWYGTDGTTVLSGAPVPPTATAGSTNYYVAQENTLTL